MAGYLRSVWPATLSDEARSNLLAHYRGIAGVSEARLPAAPHPDIPPAWIERSRSGELVGVGGLSRAPTPNELTLGRRTLYAWCAFDCMFLPELLSAPPAPRMAAGFPYAYPPERLKRFLPGTR